MKEFSYQFFEQNRKKVLAACDRNLRGRKISEGKLSINISDFYGDSLANEQKLLQLVERASIINVVGKKAVDLLIKKNFVKPDRVIEIKGVPNAQVLKL